MSDSIRPVAALLVQGDASFLAEAMAAAIARDPRVRLSASPVHPPRAAAVVARTRPDVVVIDAIGMAIPRVSELVGAVVTRVEATRGLVVSSVRAYERCLVAAVDAGAAGVCDTKIGVDGLLEMIVQAGHGRTLVEPDRFVGIVESISRVRANERMLMERLATLTEREREILECLIQASTTAEIAQRLSISPRTVDTHISRLIRKLGARSRLEAIATIRRLPRGAGHVAELLS